MMIMMMMMKAWMSRKYPLYEFEEGRMDGMVEVVVVRRKSEWRPEERLWMTVGYARALGLGCASNLTRDGDGAVRWMAIRRSVQYKSAPVLSASMQAALQLLRLMCATSQMVWMSSSIGRVGDGAG
ncbi:hypothetical protein L1887_55108 [Cichorium endivia]|nr:hypothetical protein L1887_55108 [Cichorium endivia]